MFSSGWTEAPGCLLPASTTLVKNLKWEGDEWVFIIICAWRFNADDDAGAHLCLKYQKSTRLQLFVT